MTLYSLVLGPRIPACASSGVSKRMCVCSDFCLLHPWSHGVCVRARVRERERGEGERVCGRPCCLNVSVSGYVCVCVCARARVCVIIYAACCQGSASPCRHPRHF